MQKKNKKKKNPSPSFYRRPRERKYETNYKFKFNYHQRHSNLATFESLRDRALAFCSSDGVIFYL